MSKKPIGYSKKDRDEMKTLIERTEPKSGDYVGSGTVTQVPKKKKMKRMQMGGMAMPTRGTMPNERGAIPVRGGGGVPLQGPGGVMVKPFRPGEKYGNSPRMREKMNFGPGILTQIGGGKTIPGSRGVSNSPGRISPDYAKTRAGDSPITQIESKTLTGIRPDPVSGMQPTPVPRVDMTAPRQPGQKGYGMKGGGLARKGVGMALAKGGLVKANGCAARGKTKGKMV